MSADRPGDPSRPGPPRPAGPAAPPGTPQPPTGFAARPGPRLEPSGGAPGPGSIWWLAAAAAVVTGIELAIAARQPGLSWDEVVYVSQVSRGVPAAVFDAARARGISLLVAPVTAVTSSVGVLRGYLAVASGAGLVLALLAWRHARPARVLALAALLFGGLWVTQYYGPLAMPDEWVAFCSLAAAGLFLRAVEPPAGAERGRPGSRRATLAGLAAATALAALFRPGDAVFIAAALVAAALLVRRWRQRAVMAAVAGGFAAGAAEWFIEAWLRFGGPLARLHAASREQGGFGLRAGWWAELRAVNGPTLCRPCTAGWRYPALSLWWLAMPVLVTLGVLAARRAGRGGSALLAACCAVAVALPYLAGIGYAAPRFLLPAYALAAIPVADLLAGLIRGTRRDLRAPVTAAVVLVLAAHLTVQQLVLAHQEAGTAAYHRDYARAAADLRQLGIRPPCLIKGAQHIPVAFYAGCASAPSPARWLARAGRSAIAPAGLAVLEFRRSVPPRYARHWRRRPLAGTGVLKLVGYLPR